MHWDVRLTGLDLPAAHLLMPLLAYNREGGRFVWVRDVSFAQWYYRAKFATLDGEPS
jgi:hypothetical protein